MKYKRICIDLDGTLFFDEKDTESFYKNNIDLTAKKNSDRATKWLKDKGFEIIISTCRPDYHRKYLEDQLSKNNIKYDCILYYTKPRVDLYIDDKGFRFVDWDTTINWINQKIDSTGVDCQEPNTEFESVLRVNKITPISNLLQQCKILDVGCGSGKVFTKNKNLVIDGVEPDNNLKNLAEATGVYSKIFNDISDADISNYDLICLLGILEHIDNVKEFLEKFINSKYIYLTVPNAKSFHRVFGLFKGDIPNLNHLSKNDLDIGHKRYYDDQSFKADLDVLFKNGFKINKFGTTTFKIYPNSMMDKFSEHYSFLDSAAQYCNLCGDNNFFGAEIYCLLEKENHNL